ncbi:MAG: polyprenyl synthetase family protein [Micrococcales bacterium]
MTESENLLALVQETIDGFFENQRAEFAQISPDLEPILDYAQSLLTGGKRFRALFCYWSWVGALETAALKQTPEELAKSSEAIVGITAALEIFHAAALVHDDLIDQSDSRRGAPAVHKKFEKLHSDQGWAGSAERFGSSASILTGDLMLSWASELFGKAIQGAPSAEIELACRDQFSLMRTEVMAGQYLDVLEENAANRREVSEAVVRANRVMLYKTAKYSIEAPLLIGAAFAGADSGTLHALSSFGIPLGIAFQLRDDVLGVFGDSAVTGKPIGDDLREGKRTVLVGLTRETLSPSVAKVFDEMLTSRDLNSEQIAFLQQTIIDSQALAKSERMIEDLAEQSAAALENIELGEAAKAMLKTLAEKVVTRKS